MATSAYLVCLVSTVSGCFRKHSEKQVLVVGAKVGGGSGGGNGKYVGISGKRIR